MIDAMIFLLAGMIIGILISTTREIIEDRKDN